MILKKKKKKFSECKEVSEFKIRPLRFLVFPIVPIPSLIKNPPLLTFAFHTDTISKYKILCLFSLYRYSAFSSENCENLIRIMEYFAGDYAEFSSVDNGNFNNTSNNNGVGVHFTVDDLLDFSKEDETMTDAFFDSLPGNSGDSSTVTAVDSCNSPVSGGGDAQFNGNVSCRSFNESQFSGNELCVPVITCVLLM